MVSALLKRSNSQQQQQNSTTTSDNNLQPQQQPQQLLQPEFYYNSNFQVFILYIYSLKIVIDFNIILLILYKCIYSIN